MVRGFSRFVPFLFLGLLRAPTRNSPERVRDTIWTIPEKSGKHPGLETPRFSFSQSRGCHCARPNSPTYLADVSDICYFFFCFGGGEMDRGPIIFMTGRPGYRTMEMIGGSSVPYLACTPCVPLFCTVFNRGGSRRAFRLPGAAGSHFHCTVEPSPGHIRCRMEEESEAKRGYFLIIQNGEGEGFSRRGGGVVHTRAGRVLGGKYFFGGPKCPPSFNYLNQECNVRSEIYTDRLNCFWNELFCRYRYRYRLETQSDESSHSVLVILCMWCLDYRHSTDTEFDGELIVSVASLADHGEICPPPHMATRRPTLNTPIHMEFLL